MANRISKMIQKASVGLGMVFEGDAHWIEIPDPQVLIQEGYSKD
jgi:hypothetical protein